MPAFNPSKVCKLMSCLAVPWMLHAQSQSVNFFTASQPLRVEEAVTASPVDPEWTVDKAVGNLRINIPIGQVPGEIPIPVALTMGGTYKAHVLPVYSHSQGNGNTQNTLFSQPIFATLGFGYLGVTNTCYARATLQAQVAASPYLVLEDGQTYLGTDFVGPNATTGNSLLPSWGFGAGLSYTVSNDGKFLWATVSQASGLPAPFSQLVSQHLPVGTTSPSGYVIIASKDRLRVFAEYTVTIGPNNEPQSVGVPVLWADHFNHFVTFKWNLTSTPQRVDALNQRSQGVTIRYMASGSVYEATTGDLARVDFVGLGGPSALIRGYAGFAAAPNTMNTFNPQSIPWYNSGNNGSYTSASACADVIPTLAFLPTELLLGEPTDSGLIPSWNGLSPAPAAVCTNPSPWPNQIWTIHYDPACSQVTSLTNPRGATATFGYGGPYGLADNYGNTIYAMGVTAVQETDGSLYSTGAVHSVWWNRYFQNVANPLVLETDLWSPLTTADRTTLYTYASAGTDGRNGFLLSKVVTSGSSGVGTLLSSTTYTSTTSGYTGGGLDGTLSKVKTATSVVQNSDGSQFQTQVAYGYADATCLQVTSTTSKVGSSLTTYKKVEAFYNPTAPFSSGNPNASILEFNQPWEIRTTRYTPQGGAVPNPVAITQNTWDTSNLLELLQTFQEPAPSCGLAHGKNYPPYPVGNPSYGKVNTQTTYHVDGSSTANLTSPATLTYVYDESNSTCSTGQLTSTTTSYLDPVTGTGTVSTSATTPDCQGNFTLFTDEKGVQTTKAFDLYGQLSSSATQGDAPITITYPDRWTKTATQAGKTCTLVTDGFGRLVKEIYPDGRVAVPAYDGHSRVISTMETNTSGPSRIKKTDYDLLDRVIDQTDFDGKYTKFTYTTDGTYNSVQKAIPAMSLVTTTVTDPFSQVTSVTAPNGDVTTYGYDGLGDRTSVTITPAGSPVGGISTQPRSLCGSGRAA